MDDRRAPGNAAAVFACVAADLKIEASVSVLAFLWSVASSLTAVATRIVPLGGIAAQRCLRELGPAVRGAALRAESAPGSALSAPPGPPALPAPRPAPAHPRL